MKLWEFIVELEKFEQAGLRNYEICTYYLPIELEDIAINGEEEIINLV